MTTLARVTTSQLQGYGELLQRNAEYFGKVEEYANQTASDTSGFTGVMAALIPAVEGVTALYSETLQLAKSRLTQVREELDKTAEDYEERERKIKQMLDRISSELDGMRV